MAPYIYMERNGIHIIDLRKTAELVEATTAFVRKTVAEGGTVLFVGTKKQVQAAIAEEAQRCGAHYVNRRWLGGTLTNWKTISLSIRRLREAFHRRPADPVKQRTRLVKELTRMAGRLEKAPECGDPKCVFASSKVLADLDLVVHFDAGEELRTEISAKFRRAGVVDELASVGLDLECWWTDEAGDYALSLSRRPAPTG